MSLLSKHYNVIDHNNPITHHPLSRYAAHSAGAAPSGGLFFGKVILFGIGIYIVLVLVGIFGLLYIDANPTVLSSHETSNAPFDQIDLNVVSGPKLSKTFPVADQYPAYTYESLEEREDWYAENSLFTSKSFCHVQSPCYTPDWFGLDRA